MIFGNLQQLPEYEFLEESVKKCFVYAKKHDLLSYDTRCHEIDKENLYVNIVEYRTQESEQRFFEAHRQYLDVHIMLRGEERIDLNLDVYKRQVPESNTGIHCLYGGREEEGRFYRSEITCVW